jgi:hypothetical protein
MAWVAAPAVRAVRAVVPTLARLVARVAQVVNLETVRNLGYKVFIAPPVRGRSPKGPVATFEDAPAPRPAFLLGSDLDPAPPRFEMHGSIARAGF